MKKVIMVATYFPPAGGISTFRITKFVKFLPHFKWEPAVLTVREECYKECDFLTDKSLLKDVKDDLIIYRTKIGKGPAILRSLFKRLPTRWLGPLFATIGQVIKEEKPSLLYATGDPFFPLLVAPYAKVRYGLNYVIDLRDPWKLAKPDEVPTSIKGKLFIVANNILEPIVINRAAKIIVVSEKMAKEYREAYPKRLAEDFIVIPNGYDPDDYDSIPAVEATDFTITYAGKFLFGKSFRNPSYFFEAIKILRDRGCKVVFQYIGEENKDINKMVDDCGISSQFQPLGHMSYTDTISYMKGADVLLLIGNGQETEQTGKIFDYLGCKRPVLALASKKGGIADVVKDVEEITLIENENPSKIADAIFEFYNNRSKKPVERENIAKYLRVDLTGELASVFEDVVIKYNNSK
jgi:glycosyltransferase involved in cell wall biosynthesis